ncbi:hypothetical protein KHQ88_00095 [Mycoplasmatota bacterium]|nr:hypothetical protein KHQ88_00095 [Mycoplasmatota bacterium]
MSEKNNNKDKKTNEEIRKEIEELEKLIEKVKEQNKKNKNNMGGRNPIIKINLASVYSRSRLINFIISLLVNLITALVLVKLIGHLFVTGLTNDVYLILVIFGFTLFEELYKKYMFKKHMQIVIFSVGTIFILINMIYFYSIDFLFFGFGLFISSYHHILFVLVFMFLRFGIKHIYKQIELYINKKKR